MLRVVFYVYKGDGSGADLVARCVNLILLVRMVSMLPTWDHNFIKKKVFSKKKSKFISIRSIYYSEFLKKKKDTSLCNLYKVLFNLKLFFCFIIINFLKDKKLFRQFLSVI